MQTRRRLPILRSSVVSVLSVLLLALLAPPARAQTPPAPLLPFGTAAGDTIVPTGDDNFIFVPLTKVGPANTNLSLPFFGTSHTSLFVNTNGSVSFNAGISQFRPQPFPYNNLTPSIAPLWADVHPNPFIPGSGPVSTRTAQDAPTLSTVANLVRTSFLGGPSLNFTPTHAQITTWDHVPPYNGYSNHPLTPVNTFQLVVTSDGIQSYAFFLYPTGGINWLQGAFSAPNSYPVVGFDAGDGINYFNFPGSGTPAVANLPTLSNTVPATPGVQAFRISNNLITSADALGLLGPAPTRHLGPPSSITVTGHQFTDTFLLSNGQTFLGDSTSATAPTVLQFRQLQFADPVNQNVTFTGNMTVLTYAGNAITGGNITLGTSTPPIGNYPKTTLVARNAIDVNGTAPAIPAGHITLNRNTQLLLDSPNATGTPVTTSLVPLYEPTASATTLTINGGTLDLRGHSTALARITSTGFGGLIQSTAPTAATLTLGYNPAASLVTPPVSNFTGTLKDGSTGALSLQKTGTNLQTLAGNNTYTGTTTVAGGTLQFAKPASLYAGNATLWTASRLIVNSGATAAFNIGGTGEFSVGQALSLAALGTSSGGFKSGSFLGLDTTNAGSAVTISGILANPNSGANSLGLAKLGTGTLTLSGTNTYTGGTTFARGTLAVGSAGALGTTGPLTFTGGTLQFTSANSTDYSPRFSSAAGQQFLFDTNSQNVTFATPLASVGGSLLKSGLGTLTLSAANTFSGITEVTGGTLRLTHSLALQNSIFSPTATGTLDTSALTTFTLGGLTGNLPLNLPTANLTLNTTAPSSVATSAPVYYGNLTLNSLTKTGPNLLRLAGNNTVATTITVGAGTLQFDQRSSFFNGNTADWTPAKLVVYSGATAAFAVGGSGDFTSSDIDLLKSLGSATGGFLSGSTLGLDVIAPGSTFTYAGNLTNPHSGANTLGLTKLGVGTLVLTGTNTYTGGTRLADGTLALGSTTALGPSGTLTFAGGTLQFSASNTTDYSARFSNAPGQTFAIHTGGQTLTFANAFSSATDVSGSIAVPSALTVAGGGSLTLTAPVSVNLATIAPSTVLTVGTGGALGNISLTNDGTLRFTGTGTLGNIASIIGTGALIMDGTGTLTLGGVNTFSGPTTLNSGTTRTTLSSGLSPNSTLSLNNSATLDLAGTAATVATLGNVTGNIGNGTLNVRDASSATFTAGNVTANLTGALTLAKSGTGTLTLSGLNTYTGTTTVSAGTLALAGPASLYAGNTTVWSQLSVDSGATLAPRVGGNTTFTSAQLRTLSTSATFASGSTLALDTTAGSFAVADLLTGGFGLTKLGNNTLTLTRPAGSSAGHTYTGSTVLAGGTLALGNAYILPTSTALTIASGTLDARDHMHTVGALTLTSGTITGASSITASSITLSSGSVLGVGLRTTGAFNKNDSGTVDLRSGVSGFTGPISLNAGTLSVTTGAILHTSGSSHPFTLNGGTLALTSAAPVTATVNFAVTAASTLNLAGDTTLTTALTGSAPLTKTGPGALILNTASPFSGLLAVTAGNLKFGVNNALPSTANVQLSTGTTLLLNNTTATLAALTSPAAGQRGTLNFGNAGTGALTFTGDLTATLVGSGTLTKSGSTTSTLNSPSGTFSGTVNVAAGMLALANASTLTTGSVTVASGATLDLSLTSALTVGSLTGAGNVALPSSALTFGAATAASSTTLSGVISGAGGLVKPATHLGRLTLSGDNTFAGATTIAGGTLQFATRNALPNANWTAAKLVVNSGATAAFNVGGATEFTSSDITTLASLGAATTGFRTGSTLALDTTNAPGATFTQSTSIASPNLVHLQKLGSGTLVLSANNLYTGNTTVSSGTLALGANDVLPDTTTVSLAAGTTLNVGAFTETFSALAGPGNVTLGTGGALTLSGVGNSSYAGVMSGPGSFTKTGTANLTLAGNNTFTGTTTITAGTLTLGTAAALPATATVALNGGTLALNTPAGSATTVGTLSLLANSTIDFLGRTASLTATDLTRTAGTLTLTRWSGNPLGAGSSQFLTTNAPTGFTGTDALNEISFSGYGPGAKRLGTGELVPFSTSLFYTLLPTGSVTWDTNSNWSSVGTGTPAYPLAVGESAIFASAAHTTVNLNAATRTLGYVSFDTTQNVTLTNGSLLFDVTLGTAQLTANQTGSPTIAAGLLLNDALQVSQNGSGTLTLSGTLAQSTGTHALTFAANHATGAITVTGALALGTATLTKTGPGTLTLSGANTSTGAVFLHDGTTIVPSVTALGNTTVTLGGATGTPTLRLTGNTTFDAAHPLVIAPNTTAAGSTTDGILHLDTGTTATVTTAFTGAGDLLKTGPGTLALNAANALTGNLTVSAGTLTLGRADAVEPTRFILTDAATLNLNGLDWTAATGLNLRTGASLLNTSATLSTISGPLANDGTALSLTGPFRLTSTFANRADLTVNTTGANTVTLTATPAASVANLAVNGRLTVETASALTHLGAVTINDTSTVSLAGDAHLNFAYLTLNAHALTGDTLTLVNPTPNTTLTLLTDTGIVLTSTAAPGTATALVGGDGNLNLFTLAAITGQLGLAKIGTGTVSISSDGTSWTAPLDVRAGTFTSFVPLTSNAISLAAGTTFNFYTGNPLTYSGSLSGTGTFANLSSAPVTLSGTSNFGGTLTGPLTLTGTLTASASTFTLPTTGLLLDGGTLATTAGFTSPATLTTTANGGTFHASTVNSTVSAINGLGTFTKSGTGTLTLTGSSVFTGNFAVAAGNVTLASTASLQIGNGPTGSLSGNLITNGALSFVLENNATYSGNLSGTGTLAQNGTNTLTLTGTNTHTGGTALNSGSLTVSSDAALGGPTAPLTLGTGTLTLTGTTFGTTNRPIALTTYSYLNIPEPTATVTFAGSLDGPGYLTKDGPGTLVLAAANTYSGELIFNAGTLRVTDPLALKSTTLNLVPYDPAPTLDLNGLTTAYIGALSNAVPINLGTTNLIVGGNDATTAYSAQLSGTGSLTKVGGGSFTLQADNTYSGGTIVQGGTLSVSSDARLGASTGGLTLDGGIFRSIGSSFTTARAVTLTALGGNVDVFRNATFTSPLTGPGAFTVYTSNPFPNFSGDPAHTLTLSAANTYAGATSFTGITTILNHANALPTGTALSLDTATLRFAGYTHTLGTLKLLGDATFDFNSTTNALSFADSSTLAWNGTLTLTNYNTATSSVRFGTNDLALTPTQLALIRFASDVDAPVYISPTGYLSLTASAIPEPSTYAAILGALALIATALHRRRR